MVACRHDHPLAERPSLTWADLQGHDYIAVAKASGNRFLLDMALAESPELPQPVCEARHVRSVVDMVEAGLGVAAVPLSAIPMRAPSLRAIRLEGLEVFRTVGLIKRRGRVLSTAAQRLYELMRNPPDGGSTVFTMTRNA